MASKIIFLDIDGPMIPNSMLMADRMASWQRRFPATTIGCLKFLCDRSDAKIVLNTAHNAPIRDVPDIEICLQAAGIPIEHFHEDCKTKYPDWLPRDAAVREWLLRHSDDDEEIADWIGFDDIQYTTEDNLIVIDPDAGIHVAHVNQALRRWGLQEAIYL